MKAPILEVYDKGLRMIRGLKSINHYGPVTRWLINFRRLYGINRSLSDPNYIYLKTLEDELHYKFDKKRKKIKKHNVQEKKTNTKAVRGKTKKD